MTNNDVQFFTTGDRCRIAWCMDGPVGAPVLLLSNSLGTDMMMWDCQMPTWTRHFRVLRYDQRGHGASGAPEGAYSLDRLGRDVIELLEALEIATVNYCGLSMGGMTGQWLGIREPGRLRRLVLANTSSYMGPPANWDARIDLVRAEGMMAVAKASAERWFTSRFLASSSAATAPVLSVLASTDPLGYSGCCAAIRDMDMRRIVSQITAPALVIAGSEDSATPLNHSHALADAIANAQLEILDAAHLSNVEQADAFARLVTDFLLA